MICFFSTKKAGIDKYQHYQSGQDNIDYQIGIPSHVGVQKKIILALFFTGSLETILRIFFAVLRILPVVHP